MKDGDGLESEKNDNSVEPASVPLNQRPCCARDRNREKDIDWQYMPNADVHTSGHGEHHINSSRNCHVEDLAPSPESTPDYGPDGNTQQDQKGEGVEQWGMSARHRAYCYDGLRPPNDLETLP